MEHLPYFNGLARKRVKVSSTDCPKVPTDDQVVLELRCCVQGEADESPKFSRALLARSFDNVCGNRHSCANQVAAQRGVVSTSYSDGYSMHIQRERVRLPPDLKGFEITHSPNNAPAIGPRDIVRLRGKPELS